MGTIIVVGLADRQLPLEGRLGEILPQAPTMVEDSHYYRRALLDGDCRLASAEEIAALEKHVADDIAAEQAAQAKAEPKTAKKGA